MRKTIAAATAVLVLVAGQAVAASDSAAGRVGDRIGAHVRPDLDFAGMPLPVLLLGSAVLVATVVVATDEDSESD